MSIIMGGNALCSWRERVPYLPEIRQVQNLLIPTVQFGEYLSYGVLAS